MAANTFTIYPKYPDVGFQALSASDANRDGTTIASAVFPVQTAADGSRIDRIVCSPKALAAAVSILKVFINNGGAWNVSANNTLYREFKLPVVTDFLDARSEEFLVNLALPPNWRVGVLVESAAAFQWAVAIEGGIY